ELAGVRTNRSVAGWVRYVLYRANAVLRDQRGTVVDDLVSLNNVRRLRLTLRWGNVSVNVTKQSLCTRSSATVDLVANRHTVFEAGWRREGKRDDTVTGRCLADL